MNPMLGIRQGKWSSPADQLRAFAPLAGGLLVVALLLPCLGCSKKTHRTVPEALLGVWACSAQKYKGRYFELRRDEIIFGTGEGKRTALHVLKVEEEEVENRTVLTVYYRGEEAGERQLTFYFDASTNAIRLKNQQEIEWKRTTLEALPQP
jgi:hypothetical protein